MKRKAYFAIVLCASLVTAAEPLKSGPKVGEELPGTFAPVNVTGPDAGDKTCIFCECGERPVAMVFAREVSAPLTQLIKRLDAATAEHKASKMGSFVVFLSKEEGLGKQLKQVAEKEKVQHTILRTFAPEGPKGYQIDKDADVTVVLFIDRVVKANHAFRKGELNDKAIDAIATDVARIVPAKK